MLTDQSIGNHGEAMVKRKSEQREGSRDNRRDQILKAAIKVFSRLGFHEARVSDIANQADVAYGLIYHYFENKEHILNTIFEQHWGFLIEALEHIEKNYKGLEAQLEALVDFALRAYKINPDLTNVVVLEITRSYKFLEEQNIKLFHKVFEIVERMIAKEKRRGNLRKGVDPRIASYVILGGLELITNTFVIGEKLADDPELRDRVLDPFDEKTLKRIKRSVLTLLTQGLLKPESR